MECRLYFYFYIYSFLVLYTILIYIFINFRVNKIIATILSVIVITINIYFVINTVQEDLPHHWAVILAISIYSILYLLFCFYLTIHMAVSMGATSLGNHWVCIKLNLLFKNNNYKK